MKQELKNEAREAGKDLGRSLATETVSVFMRWLAKRPRVAKFLARLGKSK